MSKTETTPPPLLDVVTEWLQKRGDSGVTAVGLEPESYDMMGDTKTGFHAEFHIYLRMRHEDGTETTERFEGTDVGSLWHHIMHSWPTA